MRNRTFTLFIMLLLTGLGAFAQNGGIDQGFGLSVSVADVNGTRRVSSTSGSIDADYSVRVKQFGIVYAVRTDLIRWKGGSISIGSPLMLGWSRTNRYRSIDFDGTKRDTITGIKGTQLAFEIPVVADLNIGLHSAGDESRRSLGLYIGVGYQYSYTKIRTSVGKVPYDQFDPVFRAGLRMGAAWETRWSIGLNVRGASNTNRTYGIHLLKEL